jgi:hypothetical protein
MKRSLKKWAVLVMIAAIAIFMAVTTASADPRNSHLLRGTYAFTGSGNCVVSTTGFDANYNPKPPEQGRSVFATMQTWEGNYTFDGHGSGSIEGSFRSVDLPTFIVTVADVSWEFNYEMTDHNRFQTSLKPGTYDKVLDTLGIRPPNYFDFDGISDGAVERDGAAIKITYGPPMKLILCIPNPETKVCDHTPVEAFCSGSHVGLQVR